MPRLRLNITGAVQGVGFRPHVYRLATSLGLGGWVLNDGHGVLVEIEGEAGALERFASTLAASPPPQARVVGFERAWIPPQGEREFGIRHSDRDSPATVFVLPDLAVCEACAAEVGDPADRRHRYPFTNCTDCGPRLSIIEALPYDRPATTMARFTMCARCQAEYEDPRDRRFHAQPNACPACGPRVWLEDPEGAAVAGAEAAIAEAAALVRAGGVLAMKGLGGFHLIVDATDQTAIARLRERKRRPSKPLAVMTLDLAEASRVAEVADEDAALLKGAAAPILLLPKRVGAALASEVAPDTDHVGVMLAYTPLHRLLLRAIGRPVVATSGNLVDEPICTDNAEARRRLSGIADRLLVHDRPIARTVDDSVAWRLGGALRLLRRARGYAPLPIELPREVPCVLAVGGHQKATVALSLGSHVFVSQHLGDLGTLESQRAFERAATDLLTLYRGRPVALVHDLHPDYASTQWAERAVRGTAGEAAAPLLGVQSIAVQHHHAHLAACLAEHGLDGRALGFTWDGSGYGPDGTVWGGEALLGDAAGYTRVAHLRPFALPGGEAAIREPRRVAAMLLAALGGDEDAVTARLARTPVASAFSGPELRVMLALARSEASPVTTSAGRLFDGVAALAGLHPRVTWEGQAAVAFERAVDPRVADAYPIALTHAEGAPAVLDWRPLVAEVLADLGRKTPLGAIAARFHNALVDAMVALARHIGEPRVALTGGCFQNRTLTERAAERLARAGFEVLLHREVPPNDGGLALGQVAVAGARLAGDAPR